MPKSNWSIPQTHEPYWTYSGLSVPNFARIASSCSWVKSASPVCPVSFISAGSPGIKRRMIKTSKVAISRVGTNSKNRLMI